MPDRDASGRVRARHFQDRGRRHVLRLEDEFFSPLRLWANEKDIPIGRLVSLLIAKNEGGQNKSAAIRVEVLGWLAEKLEKRTTEFDVLMREVDETLMILPSPVFSTSGDTVHHYNDAFIRFVRQKLKFPPSLTIKFLSRKSAADGHVRGSIVQPGFVIPVTCKQLPSNWSPLDHFVIMQ